jgi:hypothetical protein
MKTKLNRAAAALLVVLWAGPALATPVLDQSVLPSGVAQFTCQNGPVCGQSFTVGITGTLVSFELYIGAYYGLPPTAGLYDGSTSLLQASSTTLAFTSPGFYSFAFDFPVAIGDQLAFALAIPAPGAVYFGTTAADPYAPGHVRVVVNGDDISSQWPGHDAFFRTYVEPAAAVPEPAALSLVALGLAGGAARRWRRRISFPSPALLPTSTTRPGNQAGSVHLIHS